MIAALHGQGHAVLRTLVDEAALIDPNRELWETLGASGQKVQFEEDALTSHLRSSNPN